MWDAPRFFMERLWYLWCRGERFQGMACLITGEVHSSVVIVTAEAFLSLQWDGLGLGPNWGPNWGPKDHREINGLRRSASLKFTAFWSAFFQRACSYVQWICSGKVRECQSFMLSLAFSFWMLKTSDAPAMGESFHLCPCRGNR